LHPRALSVSNTLISCSEFANGSGRSRTALTTLKIGRVGADAEGERNR